MEPELEINKWYIHKFGAAITLVFRTRDLKNYGFANDVWATSLNCTDSVYWTLATDVEVQTIFENYARKNYPAGTLIKYITGSNMGRTSSKAVQDSGKFTYNVYTDCKLNLATSSSTSNTVYLNGQWAEVISKGPNFIVGKWYSNLGKRGALTARYYSLNTAGDTFITDGYYLNDGKRINDTGVTTLTIYFKNAVLAAEPLEKNVWYKKNSGQQLIYRTSDKQNYGFVDGRWGTTWAVSNPDIWSRATEAEVQDAFIKYAKGKYKTGEHINYIKGSYIGKRSTSPIGHLVFNRSVKIEDELMIYAKDASGLSIYYKGEWAEVVSAPVDIPTKDNSKLNANFSAGDYIVLLSTCNGTDSTWEPSMPVNHCYLLAADSNANYIKFVKDCSDSSNSWNSPKYTNSKLDMRYATDEEVRHYKLSNKPFNTVELESANSLLDTEEAGMLEYPTIGNDLNEGIWYTDGFVSFKFNGNYGDKSHVGLDVVGAWEPIGVSTLEYYRQLSITEYSERLLAYANEYYGEGVEHRGYKCTEGEFTSHGDLNFQDGNIYSGDASGCIYHGESNTWSSIIKKPMSILGKDLKKGSWYRNTSSDHVFFKFDNASGNSTASGFNKSGVWIHRGLGVHDTSTYFLVSEDVINTKLLAHAKVHYVEGTLHYGQTPNPITKNNQTYVIKGSLYFNQYNEIFSTGNGMIYCGKSNTWAKLVAEVGSGKTATIFQHSTSEESPKFDLEYPPLTVEKIKAAMPGTSSNDWFADAYSPNAGEAKHLAASRELPELINVTVRINKRVPRVRKLPKIN